MNDDAAMAVYTAIDDDALRVWIDERAVGALVDCTGIAAGIENSNWFVDTIDSGHARSFVLTLFERLSIDELPYYLDLMRHLAARGIPCPAPIADRRGALCSPLAGKPAALVTRVSGRSSLRPTPAQGAALATQLARMHRAVEGFAVDRPNPRGAGWWRESAARVRHALTAAQIELLDAEVAAVVERWDASTGHLPRGAIHADVFRDNVLFVDEMDSHPAPVVGGIIDFYFAGTDCFVLDLAICLNDWCVRFDADNADTGRFDRDALAAFIAAYDAERVLSADERAALPLALRAAALRFWLSRLDDLHRPRPAQLLTPHDPKHFERILRRRRAEALDGSSPLQVGRTH